MTIIIIPNVKINKAIVKVRKNLDQAIIEIDTIERFYQLHEINLSEKPTLDELMVLRNTLDGLNNNLKTFKGVNDNK